MIVTEQVSDGEMERRNDKKKLFSELKAAVEYFIIAPCLLRGAFLKLHIEIHDK